MTTFIQPEAAQRNTQYTDIAREAKGQGNNDEGPDVTMHLITS